MTPKLETLLHKLGDAAYEEMLRYYCAPKMEGICLETVRCLRVVLRHFGFAASPVSLFLRPRRLLGPFPPPLRLGHRAR